MKFTRLLLKSSRSVFSMAVRRSTRLAVLALLVVVLAAAAPLAALVAAAVAVGRLGDEGSGGSLVVPLVVLVVFVFVEKAMLQALALTTGMLGRSVDGQLRGAVLRSALGPIGISHLEDPASTAKFAAARNLSPFHASPGDSASQLLWGVVSRLQSLFAVGVVWVVSPLVAVLALVGYMVGQLLAIHTVFKIVTGSALAMLTANIVYLRELGTSAEAAKEVQVFGIHGWLEDRYVRLARTRIDAGLEATEGLTRNLFLIGLWLASSFALAFVVLCVQATDGGMSSSALLLGVLTLLVVFRHPKVHYDVAVVYGSTAISSIEDLPVAVDGISPSGAPTPAVALTGGITFRDVSFGYGDRPVLRGINLEIAPGERLAIVGLNGAGKTTLVKLLCRLYEPDGGTICADGVDISCLDATEWRDRLSVLFQDYIRWGLPAQDNVLLRPTTSGGVDDSVVRAATRAGACGLVEGLPSGWDTPLSSTFPGGVDLSGGEWQRLALARALRPIEAGARLLILDEPTASLDAHREQEFYESVLEDPSLRRAPDGSPVTSILISHRFAGVRRADRIVVLEDGVIIEDGPHHELVAFGGRYAHMFETQAQAFREGPAA